MAVFSKDSKGKIRKGGRKKMPLSKKQRNKLIIKLWLQGKNNPEILAALEKTGHKDLADTHSLSGVISRLKRAGKLPRERQITIKPEKKITKKPEKQKAGKPENQKKIKATFQIPEDLFIQIKIRAAKERKGLSELITEIFKRYLGDTE